MLATVVTGGRGARGSAEEIPLADASVGAVFAAEAIHWFDPLALSPDRYASGQRRLAFAGSRFEEPQEARPPNEQTLDPDALLAFFASTGWNRRRTGRRARAPPRRGEVPARRSRVPASWETHVCRARLRG